MYSHNGSVHEVQEEVLSPVASGVILLFCLLLGVCYNLLVIGAVWTSSQLRRSPYHVTLMTLTVVCLLDCLTNETLAFGFLFDLDRTVCPASATTFHFFLLTHSAALCLLFLERTLDSQYEVSLVKSLGAVLTTWMFGLVFTATLLVSSVAHFFPNRNACSAVKSNLWSSIFYFLGFIICWVATVVSLYLCIKSIRSQNEEHSLTILSALPTLTDANTSSPMRPTVSSSQNQLAFNILFMYVILVLPQSISVAVHLCLAPTFEPDPWTDPRVVRQVKSVSTNSLEPLLTYSRYMYNAVLPIIVLVTDRLTRAQSRLVFCCRWNEVSTVERSERTLAEPPEYDLRTPVLFATPEGLQLRIPQSKTSSRTSERFTVDNINLKLVTTPCELKSEDNIRSNDSYTAQKPSYVASDVDISIIKIPQMDRNVRFSSKVDEVVVESAVWSSSGQGSSLSVTHTVDIPLFVKSDHHFTKH